MANGLSRLASRFFGDDDAARAAALAAAGDDLDAEAADALGLVTFAPDDIDWEDEVRVAIEARAAFSPDALSGMEASLRFAGPETLETKIFGRLSAWQNWIFQRPNTTGPDGALKLYGSGRAAHLRPQPRLAPGEASPMQVDLNERIPNNVGLADDRRLLARAGALAAGLPRLVARPRPGRRAAARRLPAHRHRRGFRRLGALRPREDARLPLGHLPGRARGRAPHQLRHPQGRARVAGAARRVPRGAAPADRDPGRHRARLGRAAAPAWASPRPRSTTSATSTR